MGILFLDELIRENNIDSMVVLYIATTSTVFIAKVEIVE